MAVIDGWRVVPADITKRTRNPIREIVDKINVTPNPEKKFISLALGDPTIFGNLNTHDVCSKAIKEALDSYTFKGYSPAIGYEGARNAIARKFSLKNIALTSDDVIITVGCSGALELTISALANPGNTVLIPRPGFTLYQTIGEARGINMKSYRLKADMSWEIDLDHLESLIDNNTVAILVSNPSNPCGSNYSRAHLEEILRVAEKHKLPIIADEIYGNMVFEGQSFYPLASLTDSVPIISCSGLTKEYLVPGWRVGWIIVHDRNRILWEVKEGIKTLATLILSAPSPMQGALSKILNNVPQDFFELRNRVLQENAVIVEKSLRSCRGLRTIMPQGTLYMMIEILVNEYQDIADDTMFVQLLLEEEALMCLPGVIFGMKNYIRVVFSAPSEILRESCSRIISFCARHAKK